MFFQKRNVNNLDGGVQCSTVHKTWAALMFINGELIHKKFDIQKTTKLKKDIEQYVFDPRLGMRINSDNPALIFAEIINKSELISSDEEFWNKIKILANYSDENMKRKIYFDPKYRKLKRIRLSFYCPKYNWYLSGCNLSCKPCLALKYKKEESNGS